MSDYWKMKGYNEKHNEYRRDRYANDPDYREKVKRTRRNAYRKNKDVVDRQVMGLDELCKLALLGGEKNIFNMSLMSKILGYSRTTVAKWVRNDMFPAPLDGYYSWSEVQYIAGLFRAKEHNILAKSDTDFIEKVKSGVENLRG